MLEELGAFWKTRVEQMNFARRKSLESFIMYSETNNAKFSFKLKIENSISPKSKAMKFDSQA